MLINEDAKAMSDFHKDKTATEITLHLVFFGLFLAILKATHSDIILRRIKVK